MILLRKSKTLQQGAPINNSVTRKGGERKGKEGEKEGEEEREPRGEEAAAIGRWEGRIGLIQALIPLGLEAVKDVLEEEVRQLAGVRYSREEGGRQHYRWGQQRGSVYLADQKLPIEVPRGREQGGRCEVRLQTYERLQQPRNLDEGVMRRILTGLQLPAVSGVCGSGARGVWDVLVEDLARTKRVTERKLRQLQERDLSQTIL